jgi:hypothetical protein
MIDKNPCMLSLSKHEAPFFNILFTFAFHISSAVWTLERNHFTNHSQRSDKERGENAQKPKSRYQAKQPKLRLPVARILPCPCAP